MFFFINKEIMKLNNHNKLIHRNKKKPFLFGSKVLPIVKGKEYFIGHKKNVIFIFMLSSMKKQQE